MKKRVLLLISMVFSLIMLSACSNGNEATEESTNDQVSETEAVDKAEEKTETETDTEKEDSEDAKKDEDNKDIPVIKVGWNNELHTGNMHLAFKAPEEFENNDVYLRPISDQQLELVKDGEPIAILEFTLVKGASESVTLMTQGHMDIAYGSSTAYMTAADQGLECSILCPVQSGGVSIVASKDAPYSNFDELVEYAKSEEVPIKAGYHSPISSPRIVLEYALKEAGLNVTEDTSDYQADVVMTDLKGLSNLVPSLSSNQVELWAGPVPHPQNAEIQGVGKIIATLDELPGGKWVDFPCCTMNVTNELIDTHPEIVQAMVKATTDIHDFAQENREATADYLAEFMGLEKEVIMNNDTTYSTTPSDNFKNGMRIYYDAMTEMGKFTGEFQGKEFDDIKDQVFDLSFVENVINNKE